MKPITLTTDELHEAIYGLQKLAATLPLVIQNSYEWKWVLIIAHNTLQAFMVCAVQGSAGLGALTPQSGAKWLEAYSKGLPYPDERLDFFLELYKKIQGPSMKQYVGSKQFIPTSEQDTNVEKLNRRRNTFIHFVPTGLLMGIGDLPAVLQDVLNIIHFLAKQSENIEFYSDATESLFDEAFQATQEALKDVKANYDRMTNA